MKRCRSRKTLSRDDFAFKKEIINRKGRKVIFSQITPIIAENYLTFKTKAKQTDTLLFVIRAQPPAPRDNF